MKIKFVPNDRNTVQNPLNDYMLELDIWIPSMRKAIEFNGVYWHSKEKVKKRDIIKRKMCKKMNISLLNIKEENWINDKLACIEEIRGFVNEA